MRCNRVFCASLSVGNSEISHGQLEPYLVEMSSDLVDHESSESERSVVLFQQLSCGFRKAEHRATLMNQSRTYWNTNAQIKPRDRYIQIGLINAAPKPMVTRESEVLEGLVIKSDMEESIECATLDFALKEAERLCKEAVQQGYRAYFSLIHGDDPFETIQLARRRSVSQLR